MKLQTRFARECDAAARRAIEQGGLVARNGKIDLGEMRTVAEAALNDLPADIRRLASRSRELKYNLLARIGDELSSVLNSSADQWERSQFSAESTRPVLSIVAATNEVATLQVREASEIAAIRGRQVTPLVLQHSVLAGKLKSLDLAIAEKRDDAERLRGELRTTIGEWIGELREGRDGGSPCSSMATAVAFAGTDLSEARGDIWFNSIDWDAIAERDGVDVNLLRDLGRALSEASHEQRREAIELVSKRLEAEARGRAELELLASTVVDVLPSWKVSATVVVGGAGELPDGAPNPYDKLVGYKSTLPKDVLAKTARGLVASWDSGMRPHVFEDEWPNLPGERELQDALRAAKAHVPPGVGVAIIAGHGDAAQYISNLDRADMRGVLLEIAEKIGAPAPEPKKSMGELALQVLREWQCPPGAIRTAQHHELFAMNVARAWAVLGGFELHQGTARREAWRAEILAAGKANRRFHELMIRALGFFDSLTEDDTLVFLDRWYQNAFARLEIGHKLAAAFCLTDVPDDIEVRAPWPAWSLVLPDGLLGEGVAIGDGNPFTAARIWCLGTEPKFAISTRGQLEPWRAPEEKTLPVWTAVRNLIKGACLALSDPEKFRKETQRGGSSKASKSKRSGPPELEQVRYMLSAPVQVDFRDHLRDSLSGHRKGSSPKVQFMVRGHWTHQPYGPRHTLRRVQWRAPFWKGDPAARVLLRTHQVKDEET